MGKSEVKEEYTESYRVLGEMAEGEIVEKKSRFIATLSPADSEQEAIDFIESVRKKHYDARHNCFAFIIGKDGRLQRCSDDGEPNGTAGRPMLDVLLREELHNMAVVVTRYFGGTLLGTGGLVRAYQKAVHEGLKNSIVIEKMLGRILTIETDYNGIGRIQYILAQQQISTLESSYTDKVEIKVMVPVDKLEPLRESITEGTNGTACFQIGEPVAFAVVEGEVEIFSDSSVQ